MKVVLFCGGLGTRLGGHFGDVPKPLVNVGARPILWHVMRYYAHFGHTEFVLCLGFRGEAIKRYFESGTDTDDWRIAFADTGLHTPIGERLRLARPFIGDDEYFLANYADGLTDLPLPGYIEAFKRTGKVGCLLCVRPSQTFHVVDLAADGRVQAVKPVRETDLRISGGYFVFHRRIFDYLDDDADLVGAAFPRLMADDQLIGYRYDRFWCMDTFKEQQELSDLSAQGKGPWEVWQLEAGGPS